MIVIEHELETNCVSCTNFYNKFKSFDNITPINRYEGMKVHEVDISVTCILNVCEVLSFCCSSWSDVWEMSGYSLMWCWEWTEKYYVSNVLVELTILDQLPLNTHRCSDVGSHRREERETTSTQQQYLICSIAKYFILTFVQKHSISPCETWALKW